MTKYSKRIVRGFTLIELLAVIVILGIIMLVAIPAVTGYISGSRNDSYINDLALFIDGMKNIAITKNRLPFGNDQVSLFKVTGSTGLQLDSGGKQSPYGLDWDEGFTYVAIARIDGEYIYAVTANDANGNFIPLSTLDYIRDNEVKVQNIGSRDLARKCIGGMMLNRGNAATATTSCEGLTTGNMGDDGLFELVPHSVDFSQTLNAPIFINGINNSTGNMRTLYVVRIYTDNRIDGGEDKGWVE